MALYWKAKGEVRFGSKADHRIARTRCPFWCHKQTFDCYVIEHIFLG
jgi:hypothetical protein